jgi:hypothetical protein
MTVMTVMQRRKEKRRDGIEPACSKRQETRSTRCEAVVSLFALLQRYEVPDVPPRSRVLL